jgi:hypothetical protein
VTDGTDEWAASEIPNLIKDLRNNPDSHKKAGTAFLAVFFCVDAGKWRENLEIGRSRIRKNGSGRMDRSNPADPSIVQPSFP